MLLQTQYSIDGGLPGPLLHLHDTRHMKLDVDDVGKGQKEETLQP